jgi:hypothetical protein
LFILFSFRIVIFLFFFGREPTSPHLHLPGSESTYRQRLPNVTGESDLSSSSFSPIFLLLSLSFSLFSRWLSKSERVVWYSVVWWGLIGRRVAK